MRIAFLSDVHANREALTACLDHAERTGVERYVFLGDYVGYGADPGFVVDTVSRHVTQGAVALLGNHDAAVLCSTRGMNADAAKAIEWTRSKLDTAQRRFLAGLPLTVEDDNRLYVHANAYAPANWDYVTDVDTASQSLAATRVHATFCGHVHVPAIYAISASGKITSGDPAERAEIALSHDRRWLAVMGSVGQPRDGNPAACYAVLDDAREVLTYLRVPYDVASAARKIATAGLPIRLAQRLAIGY